MSKLASAFGKKYESAVKEIRTSKFTLGGFEFKVRIPLSAELEAIQKRINEIDEAKFAARYTETTKDLIDAPPAGVEVIDGDVIVSGKSSKELVRAVLTMENRITEYVRLLVPATGSMDEISYEDIEAEWPLSVQMQIYEAINDAIQPGYKEARKN